MLNRNFKEFIELLAKGDFAGALGRCDETMKTGSLEPTLRETWQNIQVLIGPFQKQLGVRAAKLDGDDVALVTCQFERRALDMKVWFDAKGRVTGFFFFTSHPGANKTTYAKTE